MGHTSWSTYIPTPNHPEFPSGHATINSSVMTMMENVFGENFQVTLHTYDYLGLPPRSFNSFQQLSIEMANSRVWGGIHYQSTCDKSLAQGKRVAENILNTVKFLKE
jgi:membrane-associated phospholipid phosphatase